MRIVGTLANRGGGRSITIPALLLLSVRAWWRNIGVLLDRHPLRLEQDPEEEREKCVRVAASGNETGECIYTDAYGEEVGPEYNEASSNDLSYQFFARRRHDPGVPLKPIEISSSITGLARVGVPFPEKEGCVFIRRLL